jgi:hypothetical protein
MNDKTEHRVLVAVVTASMTAIGGLVWRGVQAQLLGTTNALATLDTQNGELAIKVAGIQADRWNSNMQRDHQEKMDARLGVLLQAVHQNQVAMAQLPPAELLERVRDNEKRIKQLGDEP